MTLEEFLFRAFRDAARRILWPVQGGERFEDPAYCAQFYSPELRQCAIAALHTGDMADFDDKLTRLLWNLHCNPETVFGTKRPNWWPENNDPPPSADYLPRLSTTAQACAWLQAKTGETWTLQRILESAVMPWVWLEHSKDRPEIFGDRTEGFLAPFVFNGDTKRIEIVGTDALLTMSKTPEGKHFTVNPGWPVALPELRFQREDIERLVADLDHCDKRPPVFTDSGENLTAPTVGIVSRMETQRDEKTDDLRIELDPLFEEMSAQGDRITAGTVMPKLKARAGKNASCITESFDAGVLWMRGSTGTPEKLTMRMLQKRIDRWRGKQPR